MAARFPFDVGKGGQPARATRPRLSRLSEPRLLRALFENSPIGIAVLDLNGVIVEANGAFARLFALPDAGGLGRPLADLVSREERDDLKGQLSKLVMGTATAAQLSDLRLAVGAEGGDRRLTLHAQPLETFGEAAGIVVHAFAAGDGRDRDVVIRQQHAQRMEAIGQLAGGIAHDFNNLLTAILGFCDALLARFPSGDAVHDDLAQIRANASRGSALVRQLLAYSRRQALQPVPLDVNAALAELSKMLRRLLGPTIELHLSGDEACWVAADPGQFDQVIVNLAVNARDAMPNGGRLCISTRRVVITVPTRSGNEWIPPGDYVSIAVADTGTGIAKEVIANIFEPFFSTKAPGAGTGLGLATVYGIVRQSNAFISVDSAPGEGAEFTLLWPAVAPPTEPSATVDAGAKGEAGPLPRRGADGPPPLPPVRAGATIMLVEDEASVRLLVSRALRRQGYKVVEAECGEAALDLLAEDRPVDLLVSDVVMPGLDGRHLVRLARERRPGLRALLMSGYAEHDFGLDDLDAAFLAKPFSLAELSARVEKALAP
jgi:two-component system cell cycle sensor histidine kinase/response regulator CckA